MAAKNNITGNFLISKPNNDKFRIGYDLAFGKKDKKKEKEDAPKQDTTK